MSLGYSVAGGSFRLSFSKEPAPELGQRAELPPPQETAAPGRTYDVIIFGATGFTGRLMVEHLDALIASKQAQVHTWALVGRNRQRLEAVAAQCRAAPAILLAEGDLEKVTQQATVVISAAGPYAVCGEAVVRACVSSKTHYVDVAGETVWMHDMLQRYHEEAKSKGVVLVNACAQVCAIDDINCYLLAQRLGPLKHFREYFFSYGGTTGGTFLAGALNMEGMTDERFQVFTDPFSLGGRPVAGATLEDQDCSAATQDPVYPALWLFPAYNGHTGGRILRRSGHLFQQNSGGPSYGSKPSVLIRDAVTNRKQAEAAAAAMAPPKSAEAAKAAAGLMKQQVEQGLVPKPGDGPPPETRALYFSEVFAVAEAEDGRWAHVHYTGPEAYEVTAMAAVTGAIVILEELPQVQRQSGLVTPAYAFHNTSFVQRLQQTAFAAGKGQKMNFRLSDGKPSEETLRDAIMRKTKGAAQGQEKIFSGKVSAWVTPA